MTAVLIHHYRRTRRVWWSSVAAGLATPTLFLFALGAGLGAEIDDDALASLGVDSYLQFIGPGVLIVSAMQLAGQEGMWPTLALLRWGGVYKALLSTPITSGELAVAHVLWIGIRALVTAVCFLVVLALAGAATSPLAIAIPVVALLVAIVHAAPLVGLTAGLEEDNIYAMISRVVLFPLFLFSGAFFSVDEMPAGVAAVARATPSWHGVEAARHFASGDVAAVDVGHVVYLLVLSGVTTMYARHKFQKHLEV